MRHGVKNKKLGVNAEHKRAILRALTTSIIGKGMEAEQSARYVRTTLHKAKIVRSNVDRMITYAKKGDLSARRDTDADYPRERQRNQGYATRIYPGKLYPGGSTQG